MGDRRSTSDISRWLAVVARGAAILSAAVILLSGCADRRPVFLGPRAFADLVTQTQFGPRVPGTEPHGQCREWLQARLAPLADSVWAQPFLGFVPGVADSVPMANLIARFNPEAARRVAIGAHWDTRPWADQDPDPAARQSSFAGANDGASGVAVLLELARAFDSVPPPIGVDLVLLDGEDAGEYGRTPGDWCQGSRHFAAHLPVRYAWAIVVDLVGDRDLALPREEYSRRLAPELTDRVWSAARALGEPAFVGTAGPEVFDDHLSLLMRGIPAVDIIDIDYPYWHTRSDTPDKCSPESLAAVGRVLLKVIYDE